jgi:Spy/CpxP family protein refolding chaperone
MIKFVYIAMVFFGASSQANAQHHQDYASFMDREIKALSAQQITDLNAGKGMSLALAAELNGFPGPSHVLELSKKLSLAPEQTSQINNLFNAMQGESIQIGKRLIEQERALDQSFLQKNINATSLEQMTKSIGQTNAELRHAHLKYHLLTKNILTPDQIKLYIELRGYDKNHNSTPHHHK